VFLSTDWLIEVKKKKTQRFKCI